MSDYLPPPERPGLGSTFKRPIHTLVIGSPPTTPGLIITDEVPPELTTFYTSAPHGALSVTSAAILIYPEANIYFYLVTGTTPGGDFLGLGSVVGGVGPTVTEAFYIENDVGLGIFFDFSPLTLQFGSFASGGANYVQGYERSYNNVSLPRAPLLFVRITSNVAQLANTNEQFLFDTVNNATFRQGRAYKVRICGQVNSAAIQRVRFRVRKNVLAGALLISWPTINIDAASTDVPVYVEGVIVNTSGADVSAKLAVTTQGTAATLINFDGQAAPVQTYIQVEDIGDANMYSGVSL